MIFMEEFLGLIEVTGNSLKKSTENSFCIEKQYLSIVKQLITSVVHTL